MLRLDESLISNKWRIENNSWPTDSKRIPNTLRNSSLKVLDMTRSRTESGIPGTVLETVNVSSCPTSTVGGM